MPEGMNFLLGGNGMELLSEDNGHLKCANCNKALKRNKKLNLTFCPTCGLTRFHVKVPHHIIISTERRVSNKEL